MREEKGREKWEKDKDEGWERERKGRGRKEEGDKEAGIDKKRGDKGRGAQKGEGTSALRWPNARALQERAILQPCSTYQT